MNEEQTLTCDNGGTVLIRGINTGYGGGYGYTFDDCLDGSTLLEGEYRRYSDRYGVQNAVGIDFSAESSTDTIRYTGHVRDLAQSQHLFVLSEHPVDLESVSTDGRRYVLSDAVTDYVYGYPPSWPYRSIGLRGSFEHASDRTGGVTVSTSTPEELGRPTGFDEASNQMIEVPEDWTFTYGSLRVSAPDGSAVLLDADNGDEDSARLTLIDRTGERTGFDQDWSVWLDNLRFERE